MTTKVDEAKGPACDLLKSDEALAVRSVAAYVGTSGSPHSRVVLLDALRPENRVDRNDRMGRRVNVKARRALKQSGFRGLHKLVADYLITQWRAGRLSVQCRDIELATNIPVNWIAKAVRDFGLDNRSLCKSGMQNWIYDIEEMNKKPWFQEYTQGSGDLL